LIDLYILTEAYDTEYRNYLANGGTEPTAPTSEQLRSQFEPQLEKVKSISDTLIFHTVKYRTLFGDNAETELQATFKVVKSLGSTASDNEIKSRIISAINDFFDIDNWDFGDSFYFTELATYVHNQLVPDVANFVIVPRSNTQSFGSLFQVVSRSDEILVSSATVDNVQIIDSITAANLQASGNIVSSVATTTPGTVSSSSTSTTGSSIY